MCEKIVPLTVSGDHSIAIPIFKALAKRAPIGMIHIDTWDSLYGSKFFHGAPFRRAVEGVLLEARRVVGDGPTYISFDVDGLDPAFATGTGTPEAGGISMREALRLIKGLRGLNLIGGDVVEVALDLDPTGITALNAATLMFEMLCVLAESCAEARLRA